MAGNKFEDTRSSIQKLLNIFYRSIENKFVNRKFEQDVIQIVYKKSISNFELIAYVFDSIYDYNLKNKEDFLNFINKESEKDVKDKRVANLYYSSNNL
jgi:hypothetical protein